MTTQLPTPIASLTLANNENMSTLIQSQIAQIVNTAQLAIQKLIINTPINTSPPITTQNKQMTEITEITSIASDAIEKLRQIQLHGENQSLTVQKPSKSHVPDVFLTPNDSDRFVMFPIKYDKIWNMFKKHMSTFWTTEEIDFEEDIKDWDEKLTSDERHFIEMVLAFFAASDGIVLENLAYRFSNDIEIPEVRAFYAIQNLMETIHSETYSKMLEIFVRDIGHRTKLQKSIELNDAIRLKAQWSLNWVYGNKPFAERLVAFAIIEGVFFSGSFCSIFWLKKRGIMKGLTFSNELISRDEGLHVEFAILLYRMLNEQDRLSEATFYSILKEAVNAEKYFITEALPVSLIGMNNHSMSQYVEFVADYLCQQLGYNKLYNTENPFPWMIMISLGGKTNFFERRVGDYHLANIEINTSTNTTTNNQNTNNNSNNLFQPVTDF